MLSAKTTAASGSTLKMNSSRPCYSRTAMPCENRAPKRAWRADARSGESSVTFFLWSKGGDCKSALIACAPWLPEGRSWPGRKGQHKRAVWARPDATGGPPCFALLFIAIGPSGYWALGISMRLNSLLFLVSLSCPFTKIVWWRLGRSGGSRAGLIGRAC